MMLDMNCKPIVISCDHGYGNCKSSNIIFPTGIEHVASKPIFPADVLEWNGKLYIIGYGHKEFIDDKTADEDFRLLTMALIAKELKLRQRTEAVIYLAAGLPLTWARDQLEHFRGYLMSPREYDFILNDEKYSVRIEDVLLYPQGFAALADSLDTFTGMNMICDIGNGTMSTMFINNGTPNPMRCYTEKLGVHQCTLALKDAVMQRFHMVLDDHLIEDYLRTGETTVAPNIRSVMESTVRRYVEKLMRSMREHEYNPDMMKLYIMGGGGCLIRHFADPETATHIAFGRIQIEPDIHATARGYERLARAQLMERGIDVE